MEFYNYIGNLFEHFINNLCDTASIQRFDVAKIKLRRTEKKKKNRSYFSKLSRKNFETRLISSGSELCPIPCEKKINAEAIWTKRISIPVLCEIEFVLS